MMQKRQLTRSDVFWAYNQAGLIVENSSVWSRFDDEFVRVLNEKGIAPQELAHELNVSWSVLNSRSRRDKDPKWMTPVVLGVMVWLGFDIGYILNIKTVRPDEAALLDNYRNASTDSQAAIRKIGSALAEQDFYPMRKAR